METLSYNSITKMSAICTLQGILNWLNENCDYDYVVDFYSLDKMSEKEIRELTDKKIEEYNNAIKQGDKK